MRKRILAAALAAAFVLTASACGNGVGSENASVSSSAASVVSESSAAETSADSKAAAEMSVTSEEEDVPVAKGDVDIKDCVKLGEYKGIKLTKYVEDITEEKVDKYFRSLAGVVAVDDQNAVVEQGDTVNISFYGTVNGETQDALNSDSYDLEIGSGRFIAGFEEGLVGMKAGDSTELHLQFPDDYWNSEMAGQPVVFTVTVFEIRRMPELNDDWVEHYTLGGYTTVADFKAYIKDMMVKSAEETAKSQLQSEAWGILYEGAQFVQLPEKFVNAGMEAYEKNVLSVANSSGFETIDEYLEEIQVSREEYDGYKLAWGKDMAKSSALVEAVWQNEGFTFDDKEYKDIVAQMESEYGMDTAALKGLYGERAVDEYCMTMRIMNFIIDNADVTVELQ